MFVHNVNIFECSTKYLNCNSWQIYYVFLKNKITIYQI